MLPESLHIATRIRLTAEYTYSGRNMQTLTQQVQTPLSLKQNTFSGFFIAFLKSTWNGEHFQKKESLLP